MFENSKVDKYWGTGGTIGKGKNMLGKLLMKLRTQLRNNLPKKV